MRYIRSKLHSKKGASMLIAIIYSLFCLFVGGAILALASANGAKLDQQREEQQTYLSQRSAALLAVKELRTGEKKMGMEISKNGSVARIQNTNGSGYLREMAYCCALERYMDVNVLVPDGNTYSKLSHFQTPASYDCKRSADGTRYMIFTVKCENDTRIMKMVCDDKYNITVGFVESMENPDKDVSVVHVQVKCNETNGTFTWSDASIQKGGMN